MRKVALKYPLDWNEEGSVLIQSALNGLENSTVARRDASLVSGGAATATAALGFYQASKGPSHDGSTRRSVHFAAMPVSRRESEQASVGRASSSLSSTSECSSDFSTPVQQRKMTSPDGQRDGTPHLYIRPALRRGIKPYAKEKASTSIGNSISCFIKRTFAQDDQWSGLNDYQQDQSRHSILSDSISVISGADTCLAGFKTPEVSEHGYDWSLHGIGGQKCCQPKSDDDLQAELMAVFDEVVKTGHVKIVSGSPLRDKQASHPRRRLGFSMPTLPRMSLKGWNCLRPAAA